MKRIRWILAVVVTVVSATMLSCIEEADVPEVITSEVTDVGPRTAKCGGNIVSDHGDPVSRRGVCWSTHSNPTTSDYATSDGSGVGYFSSSLTNLSQNTTYYVRAYATNGRGTAYGEVKTFKINTSAPQVTTSNVTNITTSTAKCGGVVVSDNGDPVTRRGVCWSTSSNPTVSNSTTYDGTGVGSFNSTLTGLSQNTTYYVRAYATNSQGTTYGAQKTFKTQAARGSSLADFLGTYNVTTYNFDDSEWASWSGTKIMIMENLTLGSNAVAITGMMYGAGYDFFRACGKYDPVNKCIRLYSGWGSTSTFYFSSDPNVEYNAYFYPVFASSSGSYYITTGGYDGANERGEAWLVFNSDGSLSLRGSNTPDENGRYANGFCFVYNNATSGERAGRFDMYTQVKMVKTSKSTNSSDCAGSQKAIDAAPSSAILWGTNAIRSAKETWAR